MEVVVEEDPGQASGVVPAPRRREPTLPVQREQDEPSQDAGDDARAEGGRPSLTVWRTAPGAAPDGDVHNQSRWPLDIVGTAAGNAERAVPGNSF